MNFIYKHLRYIDGAGGNERYILEANSIACIAKAVVK